MDKKKFNTFFERNNKESLEISIRNGNEFDDPNVNIVVSVITEEHEYGYGRDEDFKYNSADDFVLNVKEDILGRYSLNEIEKIDLYLDYWDDDPDDVSTIELDGMN